MVLLLVVVAPPHRAQLLQMLTRPTSPAKQLFHGIYFFSTVSLLVAQLKATEASLLVAQLISAAVDYCAFGTHGGIPGASNRDPQSKTDFRTTLTQAVMLLGQREHIIIRKDDFLSLSL